MSATPIQIPPIRTGLVDPADGNNGNGPQKTAKEWYYFWNQVRRQVNQDTSTLAGLVTYGTAAAMPDPTTMPDGALYFQEDRGSLYTNEGGHWQYVAGTMWGTLNPDQRPTDLGIYDAGFNFRSVDTDPNYAPREFLWSQSEWIEVTQVLYGTHAARPPANEQTPARTLYVETDRGCAIYQRQGTVWQYCAGAMWGTAPPSTDQRPADLGTPDFGFVFRDSTNAPYREYIWNGTVWSQIAYPTTPQTPWQSNIDSASHSLANVSTLAIGSAAPIYVDLFGVKAAANQNFGIRGAGTVAGSVTLEALNDAASANIPMEIHAQPLVVFGNVGINYASPAYTLQLQTDSAAKPGTNTWAVASDIRTKRNIYRFQGDMDVIRKLDPIVAEYNGKGGTPEGARVVSFDAARLREIVPQAVSSVRGKLNPDDIEDTDLLGVNTHEIFYHMLRAIQYLDREVSELRQKQ